MCISESEKSTLVEYGKSLGTSDSGDVYLNYIDNKDHLNARFYAFGNDENSANVMDAHIVSRQLTKAECKGDTIKDLETNLCVQNCHKDCDPSAGMIRYWLIWRTVELRYWWEHGNVKNRNKLVDLKAFVDTVEIKCADLNK